VRTLKTQQQWVETMAANQKRFDLDDSALSQARAALVQVQKRLDVAQKMLENDMAAQSDDPIAQSAPQRDVLLEIREQFALGGTAETGEAKAAAASTVAGLRTGEVR
jgi:hypothetical protein